LTKAKIIKFLDVQEEDVDGSIDGAVETYKPSAPPSISPTPAAEATLGSGKINFNISQRGATPAVDGEAFTLVRSYKLRPSTMKKLNELKANHTNVNVYLNTIVDEAISFYYEHVFSRNTKS
jgi:hypothetical protein